MINVNDTISLIQAAEQIKAPATYLTDMFFPTVEISLQPTVVMEYRKRGYERLAPYVVEGSKGVNVSRVGSTMRVYSPPLMAPRRVLTQADVTRRAFGEMPMFSTVSASERQAKLQADDLYDLITMTVNRKNQMAAELLTTGRITIGGYADDGVYQRLDEVTYDWDGEMTSSIGTSWTSASAKIFDDLQMMSEKIQEEAGVVPTLLVVGKNVPKYLRSNKSILDWLMMPNRQNAAVMSFQPRYVSPNVMYVGKIEALNLEVVCYNETYTDDDGQLQPYVGADDVILGVPGRGKCLHAAVTLLDESGGFNSYAATYVPRYTTSLESNQSVLTLWSRFILAPYFVSDFVHARVAQ